MKNMEKTLTIISKSKEILNRIGTQSIKINGYDRTGDPIIVDCKKYQRDRLLIVDDISIYFYGELVFDEKESIYIPGAWEPFLDAIHESLSALEQEKKASEEKQTNGETFYTQIFKKYEWGIYRQSGTYDEALKTHGIEVLIRNSPLDFYDRRRAFYSWRVLKDGEIVFDAVQQDYGNRVINTFIVGPWIQEFDETITSCNQSEQYRRSKEKPNNG